MSLMLAVLDEQGVLLMTDTLATTRDGRPYLLSTKAAPVPHMRLMRVGTGSGNLAARWSAFLRDRVRALDVAMLDQHAPGALRGLWAALDREQDLGSSTATIHHVGMAGDGTCHGYAYRSTAGFASERLVHGLYARPHPEQPMDWDDVDGVDTMVSLAERIRREQSALPADERIYVGGELSLTRLTDEGLLMTTVHRFAHSTSDPWMCSGT